jgi:outer membrane receptor protein involved in Fe transport
VSGVNGSDLTFSDQTRVNLRLFADLGAQRDLVREFRFLRGARVSLIIDNLFDSRVDVRDASGETPLNYQPFLVDPLGRTVRISLRKLFF